MLGALQLGCAVSLGVTDLRDAAAATCRQNEELAGHAIGHQWPVLVQNLPATVAALLAAAAQAVRQQNMHFSAQSATNVH
jgi:hypothetical protein